MLLFEKDFSFAGLESSMISEGHDESSLSSSA
jgi:hypothetical protein